MTPGYMVREEIQREKRRGMAGRRAWKFEERLRQGRGSDIARRYWEEMKERSRRGMIRSRWENERKEFFEERGVRIQEVEEMREVEKDWFKELEKRDKERQRRERWEKIGESNYNRWYKVIKKEEVPEYLRKGWRESRWKRVTRFRFGNEVREGRYWEEEEKGCVESMQGKFNHGSTYGRDVGTGEGMGKVLGRRR